MTIQKSNFVLATMILSYFIGAAIGKILNFQDTVSNFITVTTPLLKIVISKPPPISVYQSIITGVIVFQLLSSLLVLYTTYYPSAFLINTASYAIYSLIVFTLLATGLYHLKLTQSQISKTLSNISIVAALWMLNERLKL